ncbi:MAG: hypothetical protein QW238_07295 [Candidatus Bathyarchaeia archaeon]
MLSFQTAQALRCVEIGLRGSGYSRVSSSLFGNFRFFYASNARVHA